MFTNQSDFETEFFANAYVIPTNHINHCNSLRTARKYLSQSQTGGSDVVRFENAGGLFREEQNDERCC